jgi:large subunit ribosomal protein L22
MGRAYRYVRRISHIEIVLAEKNKQNGHALATVVGEEGVAAKAKTPAKKKTAGKKSAAGASKKKLAAKK